MSRSLLFIGLAVFAFSANAQNVLIRNATVHTAASQGSLKNTDVLVQAGISKRVGAELVAQKVADHLLGVSNGVQHQNKPSWVL